MAFTLSADLPKTMDHVRRFSAEHGLLGGGVDQVGISFPGGTSLGDAGNTKLRFDDAFMKQAADGKL